MQSLWPKLDLNYFFTTKWDLYNETTCTIWKQNWSTVTNFTISSAKLVTLFYYMYVGVVFSSWLCTFHFSLFYYKMSIPFSIPLMTKCSYMIWKSQCAMFLQSLHGHKNLLAFGFLFFTSCRKFHAPSIYSLVALLNKVNLVKYALKVSSILKVG